MGYCLEQPTSSIMALFRPLQARLQYLLCAQHLACPCRSYFADTEPVVSLSPLESTAQPQRILVVTLTYVLSRVLSALRKPLTIWTTCQWFRDMQTPIAPDMCWRAVCELKASLVNSYCAQERREQLHRLRSKLNVRMVRHYKNREGVRRVEPWLRFKHKPSICSLLT